MDDRLFTMLTHHRQGLGCTTAHATHAECSSVAAYHAHDVVLLKLTLHSSNAYRQYAHGPFAGQQLLTEALR